MNDQQLFYIFEGIMDVLEYSLHQNFSFLKIHLQGFPKVCIYFNWKECKIRILLDYIFFFGGGGL